MYVSFSTKLRNTLLNGTGFAQALADCRAYVYSGSPPASANAAPTGTLLGIVTKSAGAFIAAVAAYNTITSSNTQVTANDTVTINGKVYTFVASPTVEGDVHFVTDANTSLAKLVAAINHTGTPGTDYSCAAANPLVTAATVVTSHAFAVTARLTGVVVIASTETSSHLSWGATTLASSANPTAAQASTALALAINTSTEAVEKVGAVAGRGPPPECPRRSGAPAARCAPRLPGAPRRTAAGPSPTGGCPRP